MKLLGRILRGVHAGEKHLAWNDEVNAGAPATLVLTSPSFESGGSIPIRHAGKGVGDDVSPALGWTGAPAGAAALVLIVEDPGAPLPRPFVHAVVASIPPTATGLAEGSLSGDASGGGLVFGRNTFGKTRYAGPRPIPGHGPHTYVFQLFALDRPVTFASPPSKREVLRAMRGAVIARGRLEGNYER